MESYWDYKKKEECAYKQKQRQQKEWFEEQRKRLDAWHEHRHNIHRDYWEKMQDSMRRYEEQFYPDRASGARRKGG